MRKLVNMTLALALTLLVGANLSAVDVTLPSTGVDTASYVAALVTALGGVMGTAIAAGFAIFAIWMGYKYVRKAIKGAG